MSSRGFEGHPAVLRCGRCGRLTDWTDARLQVLCGCRPTLELPPALVRDPDEADRANALELFRREFGTHQLVAGGAPVSIEAASLLVAETEGGITGALAWRLLDHALHVVALATDPLWQRAGVGGCLLAEAEATARRVGRFQVMVTLTNDNIPGIYFYQRRGYRLSAVLPGVVAALPENRHAVGFAGIPVRDEIQLIKDL